MAPDGDKKTTDGDVATALATMQESLLKRMEEGFAAIDIHIKALEEKAIGDGLMLKPANLQPLNSSGVTAGHMATEFVDTLTTSVGMPFTNLLQYSQQENFPSVSRQLPVLPRFAPGASTSTRPYAPQHQTRFPASVPQQQQPSFPNIWPAPPTKNFTETTGAPRYHKLDFPKFDGKEDPLTWLNHCEQLFSGKRTDEAFKVWLAAYYMVGVAQEWYMQLEREVTPSGPRFKE
jgi:hypothetical protein